MTRPVAQLLDARGGHAIVWFGKGIAEALSSRLRYRVVWPWFHWTCQIHSCQGRRLMRLCIVVRPTRSTRPAMRPGCTLTNFCDFVGRYMQAHPEYLDLLDARHPNHVLGG